MRQPCLGRGSFGEVHRMEDKQTGFQCAVKKVCQKKKKKKQGAPELEGPKREARWPTVLPLLSFRDSRRAAVGLTCRQSPALLATVGQSQSHVPAWELHLVRMYVRGSVRVFSSLGHI